MTTSSRRNLLVLFVAVIAVEWAVIASDYKDSVFLGTYHLEQPGESAKLVIRTDQTFEQDVTRSGVTQKRYGTWHRVGEGGVVFSREFLPLAGQELGADGRAYGTLEKSFGLFPLLALAQSHVLWYSKLDAEDVSERATYAADGQTAPSTLVLRKDHTFDQAVTVTGATQGAHGTWSRSGNGDILFSSAFLKPSGEPLAPSETASALSPQGRFLQVEIAVKPSLPQPVFRKRLLSY